MIDTFLIETLEVKRSIVLAQAAASSRNDRRLRLYAEAARIRREMAVEQRKIMVRRKQSEMGSVA